MIYKGKTNYFIIASHGQKQCGGVGNDLREKFLKETLTVRSLADAFGKAFHIPGPQFPPYVRAKNWTTLLWSKQNQRLPLGVLVRAEGAAPGNISPHALP